MSYPGQTPMGIPGMPPMPYMVGAPPPILGGVMPMPHVRQVHFCILYNRLNGISSIGVKLNPIIDPMIVFKFF